MGSGCAHRFVIGILVRDDDFREEFLTFDFGEIRAQYLGLNVPPPGFGVDDEIEPERILPMEETLKLVLKENADVRNDLLASAKRWAERRKDDDDQGGGNE